MLFLPPRDAKALLLAVLVANIYSKEELVNNNFELKYETHTTLKS